MKLEVLKEQGFKIANNWQECKQKYYFLFNNNNYTKFIKYKNFALKKMQIYNL